MSMSSASDAQSDRCSSMLASPQDLIRGATARSAAEVGLQTAAGMGQCQCPAWTSR